MTERVVVIYSDTPLDHPDRPERYGDRDILGPEIVPAEDLADLASAVEDHQTSPGVTTTYYNLEGMDPEQAYKLASNIREESKDRRLKRAGTSVLGRD